MNDKTFIVCIELNTKNAISKFEKANIGMGNPVKIIDNVYAIKAPYMVTSRMIFDQIFSAMNNTDFNIFIMKSSIDATWKLPSSLDNWLQMNI